MKKKLLLIMLSLASIGASAEMVNNESVLKMLGKGYSTEIIKGFIEGADECQLSADMDAIDALLAAGADTELITYFQKKAQSENKAMNGLYWWNTADNKPQKLNIVALSKESKGFGGSLLGAAVGIAGTAVGVSTGSVGAITGSWIAGDFLSSAGFKSDKLVIAGAQAHMRVGNTNPVFRFIIPDTESMNVNPADMWYYTWLASVQSPNEFQLVRLKQKGKGDKAKRTFPSGMKWTAAGFSSSSEIAGQDLVDFEVRQINNHTYEISFPNGLEPGEYAFFYRNAMSELLKDHLSAFDFSVE